MLAIDNNDNKLNNICCFQSSTNNECDIPAIGSTLIIDE